MQENPSHGSLFSQADGTKVAKIILIGQPGVGKSALVNRYVGSDEKTQPEISGRYRLKLVDYKNQKLLLRIFEINSSEQLKTFLESKAEWSEIFLMSFDMSDLKTYDALSEYYTLLQSREARIMLVGTKAENDKLSMKDKAFIREFTEKGFLSYFETSANENINVSELFHAAIEETQSLHKEPVTADKMEKLDSERESKGCCSFM